MPIGEGKLVTELVFEDKLKLMKVKINTYIKGMRRECKLKLSKENRGARRRAVMVEEK